MDEQQRLLERLPDYLNGHVTGADAQRIAALLASDAAWQAQAALLADVREGVAAQMAAMDSAAGLDELHRRIAAAPAPSAVPANTAVRSAWWQRLFEARLMPQFAPALVATLVAVCAVQGWLLSRAPDSEVAWRAAPISVQASSANLRVRFVAGATLAQVEAALAQAQARIVDGPHGSQRYLLQAGDVAAAQQQLRANPAVIEVGVIAAEPSAPRP